MTPEKSQLLQQYVEALAVILYEEANPKEIETLAGIEETIRSQTLKHISPKLGIFLSNKRHKQQQEEKES